MSISKFCRTAALGLASLAATQSHAFDPVNIFMGPVTFEEVDSGYGVDIFWSMSISNRSRLVVSGLDAELSVIVPGRPVPLDTSWLSELHEISGGLMPGETLRMRERLTFPDLADRLEISAADLEAKVALYDVADIDGLSLLCKPHPRLVEKGDLSRYARYDGPSPLT